MSNKFVQLIYRRFDRKSFSGLPLTLFSIVFIITLILLLGIIEDFLRSDPIVFFDRSIARWISQTRDPILTRIFLWITILGYWKIVLSSAIVTSIILWLYKQRSTILPLWISIAGSEFLNFIAKVGFHRERPEGGRLLENTFSFPSGHATIAISFYGFVFYLLFKKYKVFGKIIVVPAAILLGLLIGLSRIYLGAHFISDVLSGYLVGVLWLIIAIAVDTRSHFGKPRLPEKQRAWATIITAILLLAELSYFIQIGLHYDPFHK